MDLYEYQARDLFASTGVPVVDVYVATNPDEAELAATRLGGTVVVKAQVKVGGRGKAGGVKLASTPQGAREAAAAILGMDIKGHVVRKVMVAPAVDIAEEYYVSVLLDRAERTYLVMASATGGMDIEQLAKDHPGALARQWVDPLRGVDSALAAHVAADAGFPEAVRLQVGEVIELLWGTVQQSDATLVEVNPLVRTRDGRVLALDAKVTLDDNAAYRHPEREAWADLEAEDPLEARAKAAHLNYVKLTGQVGIIGNGAGLVMSTLDVVADAGRDLGVGPANFLDIGGGASAEVMAAGLGIILDDPAVRSVFVNVFGGITACDQVATGIVTALSMLGEAATIPLVVRLDGNAVAEGRAILEQAAHPLVRQATTMDEGAALAAQLAAAPAGQVPPHTPGSPATGTGGN